MDCTDCRQLARCKNICSQKALKSLKTLALCDNDTVVRSHELKIQTDAMYLAEIYVYSATDIFACTFFFVYLLIYVHCYLIR